MAEVEELVTPLSEPVRLEDDEEYKLLGVRLYGNGAFHRETVAGRDIKATTLFRAKPNAFIYNRLFGWRQTFAVVPEEYVDGLVSNEFPQFAVDESRMLPEYLLRFFLTPEVTALVGKASQGSTAVSRNRFKEEEFLRFEVPLPPLDVQRAIVDKWHEAQSELSSGIEAIETQRRAADTHFLADLGLELPENVPRRRVMAIPFEAVNRWDLASAQRIGRERLISHWEEKPLSEVVWPLSQTNARLVPASKPEDQWNYIGMENVEAQSGRLVDFAPRLGAEVISASVVFDTDSVLYGKLRPYLRKVIVPADYDLEEGVASSEFLNFKPREGVDIRFLATFLRSALVADYASQSTGGRMPRVAPETLLEIPIPLPPLETQREIVARLHTAQSELEAQRQKLQSDLDAARIEVENRILGRLQTS